MTSQIIIVLILTFMINLITTLSYSVRIVGIRTGRIAVSFALFNILVLISRTAYGLQAPLLAKTVENNIYSGHGANLLDFRLIILSCSVATIVGGFLIPTFQRILSIAVEKFSIYKSVPNLLMHSFSKSGIVSEPLRMMPSRARIMYMAAKTAKTGRNHETASSGAVLPPLRRAVTI